MNKNFTFTEKGDGVHRDGKRHTYVYFGTVDADRYVNIGITDREKNDVSDSFLPEEAKKLRDALIEIYPLDISEKKEEPVVKEISEAVQFCEIFNVGERGIYAKDENGVLYFISGIYAVPVIIRS